MDGGEDGTSDAVEGKAFSGSLSPRLRCEGVPGASTGAREPRVDEAGGFGALGPAKKLRMSPFFFWATIAGCGRFGIYVWKTSYIDVDPDRSSRALVGGQDCLCLW